MIDNDNVIPFGKYKGETVSSIAARDPEYLRWLFQQPWVIEKFQSLIVNVTNLAPASEETPAHNAMQVRFLNDDYRFALVWAFSDFKECVVHAPRFELISDVVFFVQTGDWGTAGWYSSGFNMLVEIKPSLGDDFPAVLRQIKKQQEQLETLARLDKLPAGFYGRTVAWVLLVGAYTGKGATFDQVCSVFRAADISIIAQTDVEKYLD